MEQFSQVLWALAASFSPTLSSLESSFSKSVLPQDQLFLSDSLKRQASSKARQCFNSIIQIKSACILPEFLLCLQCTLFVMSQKLWEKLLYHW